MHRTQGQKNLFNFGYADNRIDPVDDWYHDRGFELIAGVDEAGRGALAGPVCAAAVILGSEKIDGLNDSKKLTRKSRENLYIEIWEKAQAVGVAFAGPGRIDEVNILRAALEAMAYAVAMLPVKPALILVDGNQLPSGLENAVSIVKGDTRSSCIMAGSIIAKVTRDMWMRKAAEIYTGFGLSDHQGYGVPAHLKAIWELGPSPIHRISFAPCRDARKYLSDKE